MEFEILTIQPESDMVAIHALVKSQSNRDYLSLGVYMQTACTELLSMDTDRQSAWVAAELARRLQSDAPAFVS